jgi:hypothetical protein
MDSPSVLDLTLTKGALSRREIGWHTIEIGLDHLAIGSQILGSNQAIQTLHSDS